MEICNSQKSSTVSGLSGDGGFTANIDGIAFQTLIGTLYKDKPRAVARETIANCRDANTWRDQMYGSITPQKIADGTMSEAEAELYNDLKSKGYADPQTPYEIHIPTPVEPWLEFADYGIGLTLEQAIGNVNIEASEKAGHPVRQGGYFNTMFNSSKRGENVSIGGFGLGFKCPLSIVDSFSCCIIKEGFEHQFIVFFSKDGIPDINWLTRDENYEPKPIETDRENGVIVRLDTLQQSLYNRLRTCISDILQTFPAEEQPIINEGEYVFKSMEIEEITDTAYIVTNYHYGNLFENRFLVECGGVLYPMDDYKLSELFDSEQIRYINAGFERVPLVIRMPLGTVRVPPSREEISYDDTTIENIKKEFIKVYDILVIRNQELLDTLDFKDEKNVNHIWDKLQRFMNNEDLYEKLESILKEKLENDPEFENWTISMDIKTSRGYPVRLDFGYKCEVLERFSSGHILDYDRYRPESGRRLKSFNLQASPIVTPAKETNNILKNNFYNINLSKLNNNALIILDDPDYDIKKITAKMQRAYRNIIKYIDNDYFKKLINLINNDEMASVFEIKKETDRTVQQKVFNGLVDNGVIVGIGKNCTVYGPPTRLNLKRSEEHNSYIAMTDSDFEAVVNSLRDNHKRAGKKLLVTKASEILENIEKYSKIAKKNKPKSPKKNEIERNVSELSVERIDGNPYFRSGILINSVSYSNKTKPHPVNSIDTLTEILDDESDNTGPIYWITEDKLKAFNKGGSPLSFSVSDFSLYSEKYLGNNSIFVVKGVRTESRKAFENSNRVIEIKLADLQYDIVKVFKDSILDGTHKIFDNVPYEISKRIGQKSIVFYSMMSRAFIGSFNYVTLRKKVKELMEVDNPLFHEYLKNNDIDLKNVYITMMTYIDIDNQLSKIEGKFNPDRKRYGQYVKATTNSLPEYKHHQLKVHKLNNLSVSNRRSYFFRSDQTSINLLADTYIKEFGVTPWESDIKAVYDLIRIFKPSGGNYLHKNITSVEDKDVQFLGGYGLDPDKIAKKVITTLERSMPEIKIVMEETELLAIKDTIKKNVIEKYIAQASRSGNQFIETVERAKSRVYFSDTKIENLRYFYENSPIYNEIKKRYEIINNY